MSVSIIIPTFNEAGIVAGQVRRCLALDPKPEVIVADGCSDDGSPALAAGAGAKVVRCPSRGRAIQMNAGARAAGGSLFVFLHADVVLSQPAYAAMRRCLPNPAMVGGAFRRRFDDPSSILALGARLADWRGRTFGLFFGDQAIFVRRDVFERVGGFPEILLFEDFAFSRLLRRTGATCLVSEVVIASGRRFRQEGGFRRMMGDLVLTCLYFSGVDPALLARRYHSADSPGSPSPGRKAPAAGSAIRGNP